MSASIGCSRWDLDTPALVLDLDALNRNIAWLVDFFRRQGVAWRPHAKSYQCSRLARKVVEAGAISRFGPLWNSEEMGGAVCLAAMAVPRERYEEVALQVNAHPEIAHNYERENTLNMWFVVSAEREARIGEVIAEIGRETGLKVWPMPKEEEYFVGFRVEA